MQHFFLNKHVAIHFINKIYSPNMTNEYREKKNIKNVHTSYIADIMPRK